MSYPSIEEFHEAMQHPESCMQDQELKRGVVPTTGMGLPKVMCGGFALTYPMSCGSKKYAVRCFHKESNSLQRRYQAISTKIKGLGSPYFLDFDFQPQGIRIKQQSLPIVKMAWAQGTTLGEYLDRHHGDKSRMQRLRGSLDQLSVHLEGKGIAHGDIQTGNVLVSSDGSTILLVDYDGMYVEELKSLGSAELGQRNFQHPERIRANPYDVTLDRFSFILLNLALRGLESDPSLWDKTRSDADGIVFRANDFDDPGTSSALAALGGHPELGIDVKNFAAICAAPYINVPTLNDFLKRVNIPVTAIQLTGKPATAKAKVYLPSNPIVDASNYSQGLGHVGDQIELIGQIVEVKIDTTKHGKPYVFLNFGKWNTNIIKIAIWSEGLELMRQKPTKSWEGKWVSVVGLVDPPYYSKKYKYTHLSITINQGNQISLLGEAEARFRLGALGQAGSRSTSQAANRNLIDGLKGNTQKPGFATAARAVTPPKSSNQTILDQIRRPTTTRTTPAQTPAGSSYSKPSSSDKGGLAVVLGLIIGVIVGVWSKSIILGAIAFFIAWKIISAITD